MFSCRSVILFVLLIIPLDLFAQLEGWRTVTDPDGNRFFLDRNLKLHTSAEPAEAYKPVALEGLEYYVEQGEALIRRHFPVEGLRILKGVRLLADLDPRAHGAGVRASRIMNEYSVREKERYAATSHASSLFLVRIGNTVTATDDWMNFHFSCDGTIRVLKRDIFEKVNYARDNALFGVSFSADASGASASDALMTVNAEEFHYRIMFHERLEEIWKNKSPGDNFTRKVLSENESRILYSFTGGEPKLAGFELFAVNGRRGYFVRIFAPASQLPSRESWMRTLLDSFIIAGN